MNHPPRPDQPRAFLNGNAAHHALPQAARFVPPPAPMATASISPGGTLTIHQSLREALGLRPDQPIDLLCPMHNSRYWHLDLRPEAPHRIKWYDDQRPRVRGISLPPALLTAPLTLYLLPGEPQYPCVYPMLASDAFIA